MPLRGPVLCPRSGPVTPQAGLSLCGPRVPAPALRLGCRGADSGSCAPRGSGVGISQQDVSLLEGKDPGQKPWLSNSHRLVSPLEPQWGEPGPGPSSGQMKTTWAWTSIGRDGPQPHLLQPEHLGEITSFRLGLFSLEVGRARGPPRRTSSGGVRLLGKHLVGRRLPRLEGHQDVAPAPCTGACLPPEWAVQGRGSTPVSMGGLGPWGG